MKKLLAILLTTLTVGATAQQNITLVVDKDILQNGNYNLVLKPQEPSPEAAPGPKQFYQTEIYQRLAQTFALFAVLSLAVAFVVHATLADCHYNIPKEKEGIMNFFFYIPIGLFGIFLAFALIAGLGVLVNFVGGTIALIRA